MADDANTDTNAQGDHAGTSQQQPKPDPTLMEYILENKTEAVLWMTRIFTVFSTIFYIFPFLGNPMSFYQRAFISSAATSALRLHQRLPPFQFSREFLASMVLEDSCHYLWYSILFLGSNPVTMALAPIFIFALLHATTYTKSLINISGTTRLTFLLNLIAKLELQQVSLLRFIACAEIFLMPAVIFLMFTGSASLFLPFIYYRFITLRYASRRNRYSRTIFGELRMTVEVLISKPQCPMVVRNICNKAISFISRLAPAVTTA